MNKINWEYFGDVNTLDYNGTWIKRNSDTAIEVVRVTNLESTCGEKGYLLEECYIDPTDSWIDLDRVVDYSDCDIHDQLQVALGIVDYYGCVHCGGNEMVEQSRKTARKFINSFGIVIHRK